MSPRTIKKHGLVVAPQAEAAHEGADVLAAGGNAADAMVTAALVQGVADPHRCGIGGFGCATLYWKQTGERLAVSFYGRAGGRAREDQWVDVLENPAPDGFGYILRGKLNDVGYQSVTTPGTLAGLASIHATHGKLPWKDLCERAARVADSGFLVGPGLAEFWIRPGLFGRVSTRDRLGLGAYGKKLWFDAAGETFKSGHRMRLPDLARTYRKIGAEGAESFYTGSLARALIADLSANDALLTAEDFRSYRTREETPLEGTFRGFRILSSPLPGGGVALLQALKLIEREAPDASPHNSVEHIDRLARIFKAVWSDRLAHHGDPEFQPRSAENLLDDAHLTRLESSFTTPTPGSAPVESSDTTQLSIVDRDGNCISFSHSLGYGSGVFPAGLGFMLNNCMQGYDPRPGSANSIAQGKARSTAIAETIVLRDNEPILVLGSPGAARITAAVAQVIVNVIDFKMSASEAVVQPRLDAYGDNTLMLESRFPLPVAEKLQSRGWKVNQSPKPFGVIGRVYAIGIGPDGELEGGVDPGEPGAAVRG